MGFSKGVKSCVIACSKKVKSKAPGFFKGVAHISVRCVKACSRKLKSKTPKADPECECCSKRAKETSCKACLKIEKEKEKKKPKHQFVHAILKATDSKKPSWVPKLNKLLSEMQESSDEGLRSCVWGKDGLVTISGTVEVDPFMRRVEKLKRSGKIDVEECQFGNCSTHLFKKKEAPSTKNTNPPTNNPNPPTNNSNTTVGWYQPQGYGSYYGNGGYNNAGMYGNGGYYNYIPYNGGYNGITYNNCQPEPATYQRRIGYDHIDCAGDASECSGHHIQKDATPDKTQDKSSEKTAPKPAGSHKRN